jgi:hypothetical protein
VYNTLADLVRSLRAYIGNDASSAKAAAVRRAAVAAFERLQQYAAWDYYLTTGRVVTVAPYATGDLAFDYTGGAYERVLTLAGGTWPAWVRYGSVVLDSVIYDVEARKSDTQITLPAGQNPGADATYATFSAVRMVYPLPADWLASDQLVGATDGCRLDYVHPRVWGESRTVREGPSRPREFTLLGGRERKGAMELALSPAPDGVYAYDFLYRRRPARPVLEEEKSGRASVTGGSATVTGADTAFAAGHVGVVMRLSADATAPTGSDDANPPAFESRVLSVESATSLTLEDAAPASLGSVAYSLSSQLDCEDGAMYGLLVELARKELRVAQRVNLTNEELEQFNRAVTTARAAQGQHNTSPRVAGSRRQPPRYRVDLDT